MKHYKVTGRDEGQRLDKYLLSKFGNVSRSSIKELLDGGRVKVNSKRVVIAKWEMIDGDNVEVRVAGWSPKSGRGPKGPQKKTRREEPTRQSRPFINIIYNDRDVLVVEKPAGVLIQAGERRGGQETYVDHLRSYLKRKFKGKGSYVKAVHRLDRETSGLMVFATSRVGEQLVDQFKKHTIGRSYLAIVEGAVDRENGEINLTIKKGDFGFGKRASVGRKGEGMRARTQYLVKERYENATLLRLDLLTGRTHQARVHLAAINHPIVGDDIYGKRGGINFNRHALHSHVLNFKHPRSGKKMNFKLELPPDMAGLVDELRGS
jgi:23S rRNA pseudouridine1911/1915/1917 synthase